VRVVDGDTIRVVQDGREEAVRYIGVDTPESVKPGSPVECYVPPNVAHEDEFADLARQARRDQRGLWSACR
jgi:micrococcal nuclease